MARLRYNGLAADLGAALGTADATITFASALAHSGGTAVPTITGTDYIPLALLDADGALREVVHLTAYTSGATTGTIARAKESTTAVTHAITGSAVNGPTALDVGFTGVRAYASATQTVTSGTWTSVTFDAESYDSDAFHSTSTNPTRLTIPARLAGRYLIVATVSFAAHATGTRHISVLKNGTARTGTVTVNTAGDSFRSRVQTTDVMTLAEGDYIEVQGYHSAGAGLEIGDTSAAGSAGETFVALTFLGA